MAQGESKQIIFSMSEVSRIHPPHRQVLKDISLSFYYGAKIGVLGLNGSGKSSLLRIIAGVDQDFQGEVIPARDYSLGFLEQEPQLDPGKTVKQVISEAVQPVLDKLAEFDRVNEGFANPDLSEADMEKLIAKQAAIQEKLDEMDAWNLDSRLENAMDALRCPPADTTVSTLSGGEKRRVALCRLLLQEPDILLLDEPTNHLDAESVQWLEHHLQEYKGTIIAVTHDRYFLDNVAQWILELDRGEGIPWKGNYTSWLEQKQQRLASEAKASQRQQRQLERELEWVRMSPRARQAKGKARLSSYEKLLAADKAVRIDEARIYIPSGPRLGELVIEASAISKAYGDKLLFEDLSFNLPRSGIVGVIGPNGAGKTTLFRLLTGQENPDSGTIRLGETAKLAYADQERAAVDAGKAGLGSDRRRPGDLHAGRQAGQRPRLRLLVQLHRRRPAEESGGSVRRRTQPPAPGAHRQGRGQRAAARRADQRPRRQHPARPGRRPRRFRRLRRGHLPRPLVPGPHRHPHPGLRGREPRLLVRGQLLRLRGRPPQAAWSRGRPPAPHPLPQAQARLSSGGIRLNRAGPRLTSRQNFK